MGKKKYVIIRKQDKCESTPAVSVDYTEDHCAPHYNRYDTVGQCNPCGSVDPLFAYNNSYRNNCNPCPPVCNPCPPVCNPCTTPCYVTGPTGYTGPAGSMGVTGPTGAISGFTGPTGPSGGATVVTASPIGGDGSVSDPITLLPPTVTDGSSLWMWSPISSSYVSVENPSPYLATVGTSNAMFSSVSQAFAYGIYQVKIITNLTESFITFPSNITAVIYITPGVRYTLTNSTNLFGSDLTILSNSISALLSYTGPSNSQVFFNGRLLVNDLTYLGSPNSNTWLNTGSLTIVTNCYIRMPTSTVGGFIFVQNNNERVFLTNLVIFADAQAPGSNPGVITTSSNVPTSSLVCYNISTLGGLTFVLTNSGIVNSTNLVSMYNINSLDHKLQIYIDGTAINIVNVYRLNLLALGTQSTNIGNTISNVTCVNFQVNAGFGNTAYACIFENITSLNTSIQNVESCVFYNIVAPQSFNMNNNVNNCTFDGISIAANPVNFSANSSIIENIFIHTTNANAIVTLGPLVGCVLSKIIMSNGNLLNIDNITNTSIYQIKCPSLSFNRVDKCILRSMVVADSLSISNFQSVNIGDCNIFANVMLKTGRAIQLNSVLAAWISVDSDVTACSISNTSFATLDIKSDVGAFTALLGGVYTITGSNNTFAACVASSIVSNGANNVLSGIITDSNITFNSLGYNNIITQSQVGTLRGNTANITSNGINNVNQRPLVVANITTGTITNAKISQANTTPG